MGFANLTILGLGGALLAIPLLLLLINRKRQVIPWGAYYWMQLAAQKKKKKVRVTEWLKLFSKLLLILAAALYLARPYIGFGDDGHTLIVIDNSLSMTTDSGSGSRLDAARERAISIIRETPGRISLASYSDGLQLLARGQTEPANLERLVSAILPAAGTASGAKLAVDLLAMDDLQELGGIVVISDFQRQYYADGSVVEQLSSRLPDTCRMTLVPIDDRTSINNLALLDWRVASEGLHAGRENLIDAQVKNFGNSPAEQVPVTLSVDGVDIDRAYVSLPAGETRWVTLACPLKEGAEHAARLSLPTDDYQLDNSLEIVLAPVASYNVLAVVPPQGSDEQFTKDVFVRSALLAVGGENSWNYRAMAARQAQHQDLGNSDLVIVFGEPLRQGDVLTERLQDFLAKGGGVVSFAVVGQPDFWSGFDVLHAEEDTSERTIDTQRLDGGYLEFLQGDSINAGQIRVFRSLPFLNAPASQARLYAKGQENPLARAIPVGEGTLVCVGFLPGPGYTDFYYNPNFVQFVQRLAWEAMAKTPDLGVIGDGLSRLPLPRLTPNQHYTWQAENQTAQPLALIEQGDRAYLDLKQPLASGIYIISADGESMMRFGFNPSREDSDIEPAADQLYAAATKRVQVEEGGQGGGASRELAWLGVILLLAALLLENYAHLVHRT